MNLRSEMVPEETSAMYASVRTTAATCQCRDQYRAVSL